MSEGVNRVILLGNLGADPELRGASDRGVLSLRLATTEVYFDRDRKRQERTEWHRVVVLGTRAEGLSKVLQKGDRVFVEGWLKTQQFESRDGQKREKTEVIARNVVLNGKQRENATGAPPKGPAPGNASEDFAGDYGPDPF